MSRRAGAITLLALGAILIAGALVLKYAIVPAVAQFPDDVNTTRTYQGTVNMLNADAVVNPDPGKTIFYENMPVVIERTVVTEDVDGQKALVSDVSAMLANGGGIEGTRLTGSADYYAIDRKTMSSIDNFTSESAVLPRQGLVIGFPIGTEKRDYTGWNGDAQETVTLSFVAEEERNGYDTYKFTASSGPRVIKDPGTLSEFPPGVPRDAVPAVAPLLDLPPEITTLLEVALAALPETIELEYTYEFAATYWIDPVTGILIDIEKNDVRKAYPVEGQLPIEIEPFTVYNLNYTTTPETRLAAIEDAESNGGLLNLFGTLLPIAGLIAGALATLAGGWMLLRKPSYVPVTEEAVEVGTALGDALPEEAEA
jgi:hypothetical protein